MAKTCLRGFSWAPNSTVTFKIGQIFLVWGKQGSRHEKLNSNSWGFNSRARCVRLIVLNCKILQLGDSTWNQRVTQRCMIQSSHRFGLAAASPNWSESSLARWAAVSGFAVLTRGPFGLTVHPPNGIQTNLATRPNLLAWLNHVCRGSWGWSAANPVDEGVWGWAPARLGAEPQPNALPLSHFSGMICMECLYPGYLPLGLFQPNTHGSPAFLRPLGGPTSLLEIHRASAYVYEINSGDQKITMRMDCPQL